MEGRMSVRLIFDPTTGRACFLGRFFLSFLVFHSLGMQAGNYDVCLGDEGAGTCSCSGV